jgi:DNA polymerase-3 subunit delta'
MPFRDITGHRQLLQLIARAAVRGTLPPSLIFAGPEGVGKRMAAVALAQLLNCPNRTGDDSGGGCASCTRIARHVLKTLEEPPATSTFVLVTSRPDVLLPTVRSRCQRLRFERLTPADVAAVLMRAHDYPETDAHAAAALSDGSVGLALEGRSEEFVEARAAAAGLLEIVAHNSDPRRKLEGAKALSGAARGGSDRDELARRLRALSSMLRDLGVLLSRADERALANADLLSRLQRLQRSFDGDRALRAFAAVDRALFALDRNASPKIVADWLAFQI